MFQNKYQAYKQQSVMTMTQGEMLIALYDGLLKSLYTAQKGFEQKDNNKINNELLKAQRIIHYLSNTLNHDYEISNNLEMLYDYFVRQIIDANIKKSPENLAGVVTMIEKLRESFVQADKNVRAGKPDQPAP